MAEPLPLPDPPDGTPAGPNLELDADYGEMERAALGRPEGQFGNTIEAAMPPDWKEVGRLALGLSQQTRDLRILGFLAVARLHTGGLVEFAAVIGAIRLLVETAWDHLHPLLDPEDDNDPLPRRSALLVLTDGGRVLRPLRDVPLAGTPRSGPISWRDIAVSSGRMPPENDGDKKPEAVIRAAFAGTDAGRLATLRDAVRTALADTRTIETILDSHGPAPNKMDFGPLVDQLRDMDRDLTRYEAMLADETAPEPEPQPEEPSDEGDEPADGPAPVRARTGGGRSFASIQAIAALNSRDDALHALELAAAYFRSNEPSSPLPLLIDRAKRLAPMPFLDILRDMAPDGLSQAQIIAGPGDDRQGDM